MVDQGAVRKALNESVVAGLLDQLGYPVHGPIQLDLLTVEGSGLSVQHFGGAVGILMELVRGCALRTETPLVVRAAGIALDVHDLTADRVHNRGAPDGAIGAHAGSGFGV